jgi:hypothetical protein
MVQSQPGQIGWVEVEGDLILKTPITKKSWQSDSSSKRTCLPTVRPRVQTSVQEKNKMKPA